MKRTLTALILALTVAFTFGIATEAHAVSADIVIVFDQSGSMIGDKNDLVANLGTFTTAIANAGIDAQYGLVGFGRTSINAGNLHVASQLTNAAGIAAALAALPVSGGGFEPGFQATAFALANINFRQNTVINIALFTDEDADGVEGGADAALTANNALFNAVINANDPIGPAGNYNTLAANHGGQTFDIAAFRANPQAFINTFTQVKIQEIQQKANENVIPEPATMALLGSGLFGMVGFRRKKRS